MNVSVGARWEEFIEQIVKEGRYGSASEVVREGLRLVEEREAALRDLKASLAEAIADPRRYTAEEVRAHLHEHFERPEQRKPSAAE
jgi:antitoxin ParD1/3/4